MGLPIARNLLDRGFAVVGYRRSPGDELTLAGGTNLGSASEVAGRCDVLLSIVPGADAVDEVVAATTASLKPGTVHIEMSTIPIERKRRARDVTRAAGGDLLDCPISGSPPMVAPRLATTFVSGERASADKIAPVLDAISGPWVYTGAFGTGTSFKYVANMLIATHTAAAAEAILLARRLGLDLELVQQTLDNSIGASAIWKQRGPMMRTRQWSPAPGPIATLHEILEQIDDAARAAAIDPPVFSAAKALFDKAMIEGWSELDIAAIHDLLAGADPAIAGDDHSRPRTQDQGKDQGQA
jgi:3-hydroxyisobutyrate dehydrogenase